MTNFIDRMQAEKTPHERRQFALRVASACTAVLFIGWIATLGVRIAHQSAITTANQNNSQSTAAALEAVTSASSTPNF